MHSHRVEPNPSRLTEQVVVRVTPEERAAVEAQALAEQRSVAFVIRRSLRASLPADATEPAAA